MRFPNKFYSYEESVISKFPMIIEIVRERTCSVSELYLIAKQRGVSATELIEVLDCLYVLNKVIYDANRRLLVYVDGN